MDAVPERTSLLRRWRWHVELAASLCAIAGAADALLTTTSLELPFTDRLLPLLVGAGVGSLAGAFIGTVQVGVTSFIGFSSDRTGLAARLSAATSRDDKPRVPVVAFHAELWSSILFGALALTCFWAFFSASTRIKEETLREVLIVGTTGAAIASTLALVVLFRPLTIRWVTRLDTLVKLPFPKWRWVRFAAFLMAPALAIALPMFATFGVKLGIVSRLLAVLVYAVIARAVGLAILDARSRFRAEKPGRLSRALGLAVSGLHIALGSTAIGLLQFSDGLAATAARGWMVPVAVNALQNATDVDRDGVSSLFGGRDCAPFDGARSPAQLDIPANGIDENCDGGDAEGGDGLPKLPVFAESFDEKGHKRYNVLLYIVDSLRADHLPLHGYKKNTSPALSAMGKEAWVFERAYSQSSNTSLSVPSMFAGKWPGSMRWKRGVYPVASSKETYLPELLQKQGYHTALMLNHWVSRKLPGIQYGFDQKLAAPAAYNWRSGNFAWSNAVEAMATAAQEEKPFFIAVHIDDVHHPYVAYRGHPVPRFPNRDKALSNYDKGIAVFDRALSMALAHLENRDLLDETIVIVTSDHGEEFLEHGGTIHSRTCYVESVHVPLVMRVPGFDAQRIEARVALADVTPTLLQLLGLKADAPQMDGQSLLIPVLEPKRVDPERPIFCSIFQMLSGRKNFFVRSVRTERMALFHEMLSDGLELYDTMEDPGEKENLKGDPDQQQRIDELQSLLRSSLTGNLFRARSFR